VGRKKRIPDGAEGTTVYLTPRERLVLDVLLRRRQDGKEERAGLSEILVDGLWRMLEEEGISKKQIASLFRGVSAGKKLEPSVLLFPKRPTR
jgi:hypothetical protein